MLSRASTTRVREGKGRRACCFTLPRSGRVRGSIANSSTLLEIYLLLNEDYPATALTDTLLREPWVFPVPLQKRNLHFRRVLKSRLSVPCRARGFHGVIARPAVHPSFFGESRTLAATV